MDKNNTIDNNVEKENDGLNKEQIVSEEKTAEVFNSNSEKKEIKTEKKENENENIIEKNQNKEKDISEEINITQNSKNKPKKVKKEDKESGKDFKAYNLEDFIEKLDKKDSGIIRSLTAKRFTSKVSRDIILTRIVTISLVFIALIISFLYFLSYTYINSGYGIGIMTEKQLNKSISLSDDSSFERMTVGLRAKGIESMDNITYTWLPLDLYENQGGSHNGENFVAYTFYIINSGNEDLEYSSVLSIKHKTKDVETAIRVMIYHNNIPTVYTHTYEDQIDSIIEQNATVEKFHSSDIITQRQSVLAKGRYEKFTVVIWLEGEDVDCVDDKRSGELQLAWRFNVVLTNEVD